MTTETAYSQVYTLRITSTLRDGTTQVREHHLRAVNDLHAKLRATRYTWPEDTAALFAADGREVAL